MNFLTRIASGCLVAISCVSGIVAQSGPVPSGHWEGAIQLPNQQLDIEIDLGKNDRGEWIGAINVPVQRLRAFPLGDIVAQGTSVSFAMKGIPGGPAFRGTISQDGQSIGGNFSQSGASFSFQLKRTGEAKIEAPPRSAPIGGELVGRWEGTLEDGEQKLRLVLKLSNQNDAGTGTLVSVDQGGAEFPITVISHSGSNVNFEIRTLNASYVGELNKGADQIAGEWSQGGATFPLTFKRATMPEKK